MNVTGVSQSTQLAIGIAVEKQQQASTREQGQQALQLIESASPSVRAGGGVGQSLNITA